MNISYQYEILSVDGAARCMEVLFKSDGLPDVTVSARIPFEGEDLDAVVRSFAPFAIWQPMLTSMQNVQVGYSNTVSASEEDANVIANAKMWQQLDFEKNVAKVLVKFGVLEVDPTEIQTTKL
jgi:hypothetical protein